MQSNKQYTNSTFTKRVDHEGGDKRGKAKLASPSVCGECGSVYTDGHWTAKEFVHESAKHKEFRPANIVVCPACKQVAAEVVGGYVRLSGRRSVSQRNFPRRLCPDPRFCTWEAENRDCKESRYLSFDLIDENILTLHRSSVKELQIEHSIHRVNGSRLF